MPMLHHKLLPTLLWCTLGQRWVTTKAKEPLAHHVFISLIGEWVRATMIKDEASQLQVSKLGLLHST